MRCSSFFRPCTQRRPRPRRCPDLGPVGLDAVARLLALALLERLAGERLYRVEIDVRHTEVTLPVVGGEVQRLPGLGDDQDDGRTRFKRHPVRLCGKCAEICAESADKPPSQLFE
jgi:hypothetical protein